MRRIEQFPPYGALARPYARQIKDPVAPVDFASESAPLKGWLTWIEETTAVINECLWPSWNYSESCWESPNIDLMNDLTRADFSILKSLIEADFLSVTAPISDVAWREKHLEFFTDEDQDRLGLRVGEYSAEFPATIRPFDRWSGEVFRSKIGHTSMHLKHKLQRPRAYQISAIAGVDWFTWNLGATSMSPSMSSGHALQGLMFAAGTFEALLQKGVELTPGGRIGLAQFGVDIGDRRVFAGIHYPSDNIASWIAVGRLARKVFRHAETFDFIRFAVTTRSEVYKRLTGATAQHTAFVPALEVLDSVLASVAARR